MSWFACIDDWEEAGADRCVAIKHVREGEPAVLDHFPTFPILPGVMMLEMLAQAARRAVAETDPLGERYVIGGVRALKYGAMVKPGMSLRVEVVRKGETPDGGVEFKGVGVAVPAGGSADNAPVAVSGRFTLRPPHVIAPRASD